MNKQLIITYFEEFKHWLNGGNLQAKFVYDQWEEAPKDVFSYSTVNFILVIDDEYVEFRKALAEGKTVEYNFGNYGINRKDFHNVWKDLDLSIGILAERASPENYRIKPDVPKFKVGDWVIHNGVVKQVTMTVNGLINSLDKQLAVIKKEESLELWKPKINEYFWYKNDLVKFDDIKTNYGTLLESIRGCSYHTAEQNFEDFCEPFIGKLPSYLKELNKNE